MSTQDWQSKWGVMSQCCTGWDKQGRIWRAENEDECFALGWWKRKPYEVAGKMFKAISQKYSICNHTLGTGKKHAALTDNELSQEPHRLEWTAQLEILQITVVELCPGALTLENLGGLHFKLCLSLEPASHNGPEGHRCLPGSQWQHLSSFLSLPDTEKKPTYFHLICNNRVWSSKLATIPPCSPFISQATQSCTEWGLGTSPSDSKLKSPWSGWETAQEAQEQQKYSLSCCSSATWLPYLGSSSSRDQQTTSCMAVLLPILFQNPGTETSSLYTDPNTKLRSPLLAGHK